MPRKQTLSDFAEEIVAVPDFTPGPYGMDLVIRGDMNDREWRRWNAISQTTDLKQMMIKHRKANGPKGLRDAVLDFLRTNNIQLKDDIEDA